MFVFNFSYGEIEGLFLCLNPSYKRSKSPKYQAFFWCENNSHNYENKTQIVKKKKISPPHFSGADSATSHRDSQHTQQCTAPLN